MIALTALLLAAVPVAADSPRAFLTRLYARYEKGNLNPPIPQSRLYTPEMVREMELNSRLHGSQEVGLIDYDPVCQCQDMADLRARIGQVSFAGSAAARAQVTLRSQGAKPQIVRIRLARTPAGWRIADIGRKEEPSLLAALRRDNAKMRRGRR